MKEKLLRVANVLLFAFAVLFLATLQTSLWFQIFGYFPSPAFWIPALVYVALSRSTLETVIFAYVSGFVLSTMTAMSEGVLMIVCLGVAIATQLFKERIYWTASSYVMMTCGLAALLFHVMAWLVSYMVGDHPMTSPEVASWLIEALLTPLIAPSLFPVFRWFDSITQREQDAKEYLPRYKLLYGLVTLTVVIFFMRLWYLQIVNGAELRTFSEQNSIKETKIAAPRGIIYDRDGRILVENLPGFQLTVSPQYISDMDEISDAIGKALNMPADQVEQTIEKSKRINGPFRPVRIKDNLSRDEIFNLAILKDDFPIDIKENVLRYYPLKDDGAQLFGYVSEISKRQLPLFNEKYEGQMKFQQGDLIGKAGLEEVLDRFLRGKDGTSVQQVDARGREALADTPSLLGTMSGIQSATNGQNVILTIDKDIQEAGYNAFMADGKIGAAVAMKSNGEILAWISAPSFDPNEFSTGISAALWSKLVNDPDRPLRNKVIQDHNSPGSTFKPLMSVAALTEGVVTATTLVACPPVFRFGNRPYHDSVKNGHGNLVITQAIEQSSNVFFYKMGIALGIDRMFKYCDAFGIGHKTGVDLGGEVAGLMPNAEWKKDTIGEEWQPGENLSVAIGQGFVLTTPLQMAVAYNAIGTYGKLVKPFVVKRIMTPDNKIIQEFEPQISRDLADPSSAIHVKKETFDTVKEGMRMVVNGDRGTARAYKLPFIEIAGKTGSSQVISFSSDSIFAECETRPKYQRPNAWFIGYAPADKPEIAFGILSEHGCHGAYAAPVAKAMVQAYVAKYHPEWLARNVKEMKKAHPPVEVDAGDD